MAKSFLKPNEIFSRTKCALIVRGEKDKDLSGLSRDTENALNKLEQIFDKKTIEEQQELAKLFGEVAFEEVHKLADKMGWDDGSKEKIILHGLVGGIMAELGGGKFADGLTSAAVNEAIIKAIGDLPVEYQQLASALVGAAVAEITGGDAGTGASVAASGTKNNWQEEDKNKEMLNSLVISEEALQEAKNQVSQNEVEYDPNKTFEANMHDILDAGGFIPIIGIAADGTNAILYCYEGEYIQALITVGAAIPLVEYGVAGVKLTQKVDKAEDFVQKFGFDLQLFAKDGSKIPDTNKIPNGSWQDTSDYLKNKGVSVNYWNKGSFDSAQDSIARHFEKHGQEVGAVDVEQYMRKAEAFKDNLKGATTYPVYGEVQGVIRYVKNGKYIDLAPDNTIISFGRR